MDRLSRRGFLGAGAAAAVLTRGAARLWADPLKLPIGCQTWPVRETIGKDLDGTLANLAAAGFRAIELCSPPGYATMGFGPLASMKGSELRAHIEKAGLKATSCHFGFGEMKDHLDDRIAWAKEIGLPQMVISSYGIPKEAKMADWMKAADDSNKIGEKTKKAGLQLGYHNHDFEFHKIDGELIYDKLMAQLDPKLVKMQFQVSVGQLGYKAADYFEKYPGRFLSIHCQDWTPDKKEAPMGKGVVDWKNLFAAAKRAGVKNYFVEMDLETMKASVPYLHSLA